jgi:hypothetical protein
MPLMAIDIHACLSLSGRNADQMLFCYWCRCDQKGEQGVLGLQGGRMGGFVRQTSRFWSIGACQLWQS